MLRNLFLVSLASFGLLAGAAAPARSQGPGFPVPPGAPGVINPAFGVFQIQRRQPFWQQREFPNRFEAQRFAERKRGQGFEVRIQRNHPRDVHVRYRMPFWQTFRTAHNLGEAQAIQQRLLARGYQVRLIRA